MKKHRTSEEVSILSCEIEDLVEVSYNIRDALKEIRVELKGIKEELSKNDRGNF